MTVLAPDAAGTEAVDPRDPLLRLQRLFDAGTVSLLHDRDDSGVLAARGTIAGRPTFAYVSDATVMGGAMGIAGCAHMVDAIDAALEAQAPIVGLWHSGGARLAEGVAALNAVGLVFEAMVRASGAIPQISVVLGFAAGGAAYGPALTDVVIMAPEGRIFVTGPDVVRSVTGEQVTMEELGGPLTHGRKSGVAHIVSDSEAEAFTAARDVVTLLDQPGTFDQSAADAAGTDLGALLPDSPRRAYDVHPIVTALLDPRHPAEAEVAVGGEGFVELQGGYARNIVTGLGRLAGRTVGVIANNPLRLGGTLDPASAEKAARFVRFCDAFGVPLVVLVDVPGYLPGVQMEYDAVVRRGAKLLHAFAEAVVPRVTVVTRKIYGGAYIAMNAAALGATAVYAWPGSEVAVMGAEAAVKILHKREIAAAEPADRDALIARLAAEQARVAGGVERAVEIGVVDEEIDPALTRSIVTRALAAAPVRRGAHKNIPL